MINLSLEWETVEIKSIADVTMGQSPQSKFYNEDYEGMPFLQGNKTFGDKYPTFELYTTSIKKVAEKGTVLMSVRAPVGDLNIATEDICIGRGVCSIKMKKGSNEFLYYLLKANISSLINKESGTVFGSVNKNDIESFEVKIPKEIKEQHKILAILKNIDEKIRISKEINHNLEQLAKSIYKHHFIDMKPYMLGGYIRESPLGIIPKDWSVQLIGEFVDDMKNGGTPRRGESAYWENGTIPWLKTGEINNNIILKSEEHITELGLKNSSAKLLPKNSIIMALYGKGTAARIGLLKIEATTNQACCAMICNDLNKTLFLYLFLLFNQKEIENLASGSVQQNLSKDLIANLNLIVPPIEIIENLPFKEIFDTIANNYFEIEYLTNLRDTLLPKLMSGEVDVSKINCDL